MQVILLRITLVKYISLEIWSIFLTCMMIFIFIIMSARILDLTELIINKGAGLKSLFNLILCLLPRVILTAMPVACLMAVLLSYIRMASDNEITALHSSGISLYQLMPPVLLFCFISLIFSFFLTMFWNPYGFRTENRILMEILKSSADSMVKERVKERVFNTDLIKDVMFYVNSYSLKDKIMEDVFIVDKRHSSEMTYVAKKGRFLSDKNGVMMQLFDGAVFTDKDGKSQVTSFKVSSFKLELDDMTDYKSGNKREPEEMYPGELLGLIRSNDKDKINKTLAGLTFYEMFSIPFAVFFIGIAGAPLGAQIRAQGRTKGIVVSLLLFLSYYIILMSVRYMCENGVIYPAYGVWLPVLFLLLISTFLIFLPAGRKYFDIISRFRFVNKIYASNR
jgi:lipopolysaccharide export system permease protein